MDGGSAAKAILPMTSPLERLVYRSEAVLPTDGPPDLSGIVAAAVRNNGRQRLTGALALESGAFVQVLEGDPEALTELMAAIEVDPRHRNVRILARWPVPNQVFLGWAMVLVDTKRLSAHHSKLVSQTGSGAQVTAVLLDLANARLGAAA